MKPLSQLSQSELKDLLFYEAESGQFIPLSKVTITSKDTVYINGNQFNMTSYQYDTLKSKLLAYETYVLANSTNNLAATYDQTSEDYFEKIKSSFDTVVDKARSAIHTVATTANELSSDTTNLHKFVKETDLSPLKQKISENLEGLAPIKDELESITKTLKSYLK